MWPHTNLPTQWGRDIYGNQGYCLHTNPTLIHRNDHHLVGGTLYQCQVRQLDIGVQTNIGQWMDIKHLEAAGTVGSRVICFMVHLCQSNWHFDSY